MSTIVLSDTAEKYLAKIADNLVVGTVELWQLPPSLAALWGYGFAEGRESLAGALAQAEADRDCYYELWANPGAQLSEVRQRRIDQGAETYWDDFIRENRGKAA